MTHPVHEPRLGRTRVARPAVDAYLDLLRVAGGIPQDTTLELATCAEEEVQADEVCRRLKLDLGHTILLNTGGAYGAAKTWPAEHFAAVARKLVGSCDSSVLVLCGPAEREEADKIVRVANHDRVHSLAEQSLSIGLSKALIRRSRLLITTDSGPRHLAAAFNVPTIALFGPTDPNWSINYHPHESILRRDVPCGPCGKRVCPLEHHECMRELSPEQVFMVAMRRWRQHASAA